MAEDQVITKAELNKMEALNNLEGIEDTTLPALVKEHYKNGNKSQIIISTKHLDAFRRRWLYRLSKRKDKAMIKMAKLKLHFDRQREIKTVHDLKAYIHRNKTEIIKLVIYCIFTAFMTFSAPQVVPELIKNFFSGG